MRALVVLQLLVIVGPALLAQSHMTTVKHNLSRKTSTVSALLQPRPALMERSQPMPAWLGTELEHTYAITTS